jgi:hypothetical protein
MIDQDVGIGPHFKRSGRRKVKKLTGFALDDILGISIIEHDRS